MRAMFGRLRLLFGSAATLTVESLSGRLLLLTIFFVLVSEVLIFAPQIGQYHRELLNNHIQSAELAILPFTEAGGEKLSPALRRQLLRRAGAAVVLLKRADQSELFLVDGMPAHVDVSIDLTNSMMASDTMRGVECLFRCDDRMLYVVAPTHVPRAQSIGIILSEAPIRIAMFAYARRIVAAALFLAAFTAVLVFTSLYFFFVRPMRRITHAMVAFRDNPEDPARIIAASNRRDEIGTAERELAAMQRDLYGFLQQKTRLAALGAAVARIQHDLRNILANAQLASDRLAASEDPIVKRLAPRLVASIDRAVSLATNTLRYCRADERPPERKSIALAPLADEAGESAIAAATTPAPIALCNDIDPALHIDADPDHLFRMLLNLARNAVQALAHGGHGGEIRFTASANADHVALDISDTGPGIPESVRERLFQPFSSGSRGGSGLGLAIARDLARAHGGDVILVATGENGTVFRINIPQSGSE